MGCPPLTYKQDPASRPEQSDRGDSSRFGLASLGG
jgi:hypothetical protein